jgi:hypothetical protein
MKYSKSFRKWILPMVVLIFLVGMICYIFFIKNKVKEGEEDMGKFHSKISYSRFETLSTSQKKKFGPPFGALKNFINTNFKNLLSIDELKNRSGSDIYQVSYNNKYLKWTLKNNVEYFFKITDETLTAIGKNRSDVQSKKIDDCIIKLTTKDFDYAYANDVFEGIDKTLKPEYDKLLDIDKKDDNKQIANPILRGLYNNQDYSMYISCNDNNVKYEFMDSPFSRNGSYSSLNGEDSLKEEKIRQLYNTLTEYLLNRKLITSDIKDPYFYFEIVHDNLNILYATINDIINNNETITKQFSLWVGKENMRIIYVEGTPGLQNEIL